MLLINNVIIIKFFPRLLCREKQFVIDSIQIFPETVMSRETIDSIQIFPETVKSRETIGLIQIHVKISQSH